MSQEGQTDDAPDERLAHALQAELAKIAWWLVVPAVVLAAVDYSRADPIGPGDWLWRPALVLAAALVLHQAWFLYTYGRHADGFVIFAPNRYGDSYISGSSELRQVSYVNVVVGVVLLLVAVVA